MFGTVFAKYTDICHIIQGFLLSNILFPLSNNRPQDNYMKMRLRTIEARRNSNMKEI